MLGYPQNELTCSHIFLSELFVNRLDSYVVGLVRSLEAAAANVVVQMGRPIP